MRKSCVVGMCNAIQRNYLKIESFAVYSWIRFLSHVDLKSSRVKSLMNVVNKQQSLANAPFEDAKFIVVVVCHCFRVLACLHCNRLLKSCEKLKILSRNRVITYF